MVAVRPAETSKAVARMHRAALVEDAVHQVIERGLRNRGWKPYITAYTGYGAPGWARVMGRVLLSRPRLAPRKREKVRGWRSFTTSPVWLEEMFKYTWRMPVSESVPPFAINA